MIVGTVTVRVNGPTSRVNSTHDMMDAAPSWPQPSEQSWQAFDKHGFEATICRKVT